MNDPDETMNDETQWRSQVNQKAWNQLYDWTSHHANWRLSALSELIAEMRRLPVFLGFYPYTSHFTLCLSSKPFALGDGPRVEALGNGRFKVYGSRYKLVEKRMGKERDYEVLGEGNVKVVVDLIRKTINLDTSPASDNAQEGTNAY